MRYLGYDIRISRSQDTKRTKKGLQRVWYGKVQLYMPKEKWIAKRHEYGAFKSKKDENGKEIWKPLHRGALMPLDDVAIISKSLRDTLARRRQRHEMGHDPLRRAAVRRRGAPPRQDRRDGDVNIPPITNITATIATLSSISSILSLNRNPKMAAGIKATSNFQ